MKYLTLCLLTCFYVITMKAQCPPNLDFEDGTLNHWQCMAGSVASDGTGKNVITLTNSTPIAGRHEIISTSATPRKDPFGNFPTLCPYGGNYSVKLGNELT